MTEPQRRTLRHLIDQARRERLTRQKETRVETEALPTGSERECEYCHQLFLISDHRAGKRRFCSTTHKGNFHRRERMRREREWVQALKTREAMA